MTLFRFLQAGVVTALTLWALNYVHPLLMAIGVAFLVDLLEQAFLSFSKEEGPLICGERRAATHQWDKNASWSTSVAASVGH
jgi:hypothetical protein